MARETTSRWLAAGTLIPFGAVAIIGLVSVSVKGTETDLVDLVKTILTLLVGLIGTAFGFYVRDHTQR